MTHNVSLSHYWWFWVWSLGTGVLCQVSPQGTRRCLVPFVTKKWWLGWSFGTTWLSCSPASHAVIWDSIGNPALYNHQCNWILHWWLKNDFLIVILSTVIGGDFSIKHSFFFSLTLVFFFWVTLWTRRGFCLHSFLNFLLWGILNMNKSRQTSVMSLQAQSASVFTNSWLVLFHPYSTHSPPPKYYF